MAGMQAPAQRRGDFGPGRWVGTPDGYAEFVRDAAELVAANDPAPPAGLPEQLSIFDVLDGIGS